MASAALTKWQTTRCLKLDQILDAHAKIGGVGRGRRYATEQINFAYLFAVAAQFQGFSRDLHSETAGAFAAAAPTLSSFLQATLTSNRGLDRGNANRSTIAEDFAGLGMENFWDLVAAEGGGKRTAARLRRLEQMNIWRNAVAHDNFEKLKSKIGLLDGQLHPRLVEGAKCRKACDFLAVQMAAAVRRRVHQIVGTSPW